MPARTIAVVWNCGVADRCTNLEHPGRHGGDKGYHDAYRCLMGHDLPDLTLDFSEFAATHQVVEQAVATAEEYRHV